MCHGRAIDGQAFASASTRFQDRGCTDQRRHVHPRTPIRRYAYVLRGRKFRITGSAPPCHSTGVQNRLRFICLLSFRGTVGLRRRDTRHALLKAGLYRLCGCIDLISRSSMHWPATTCISTYMHLTVARPDSSALKSFAECVEPLRRPRKRGFFCYGASPLNVRISYGIRTFSNSEKRSKKSQLV